MCIITVGSAEFPLDSVAHLTYSHLRARRDHRQGTRLRAAQGSIGAGGPPAGGGRGGGGGGGGGGGDDASDDQGKNKKSGLLTGWEQRVAYDPEFPLKVLLEQVRW